MPIPLPAQRIREESIADKFVQCIDVHTAREVELNGVRPVNHAYITQLFQLEDQLG